MNYYPYSSGQPSSWNGMKIAISAFLIIVLALLLGIVNQWSSVNPETIKGHATCILDVRNNVTKCRPHCDREKFSLFGMDKCHQWLTCDDIRKDVHISNQIIGGGAVKMVKLGQWKGHDVAVSFLRDTRFEEDFLFNMQMLIMFNTDNDRISNNVVQLIGLCNESSYIVITEYHPLGSADAVRDSLKKYFPSYNSLSTHFSLCLDFVRIISMLHNHITGKHVLCDANDPEKALSQFLLSDDLHLVLNDMDALPVINEEKGILIKCGHRELFGDFVAPEQIWPYDNLPFNDSMMPGYTEKIDIWKIPDVFNYLLDDIPGSNRIKLHFFNIHTKCKNAPDLRPSAKEILMEYEQFFKEPLHRNPT